MKEILGPHTGRVLYFIVDIDGLSPDDIDLVCTAWKLVPLLDRAAAWTAIRRSTNEDELNGVRKAAMVARRSALHTARRHGRHDWAFWSAAWDGAAALSVCERISAAHYHSLAGPMGSGMRWLEPCPTKTDVLAATRRGGAR